MKHYMKDNQSTKAIKGNKLFYLILFFASLLCYDKTKARPIKDLFLEMPQHVMPLLSQEIKKELVNHYTLQAPSVGHNRLGGSAYLDTITDNLLIIRPTEKSQIELQRLISEKGDTILAMIHSVMTPQADSEICFYNTSWTPIDKVPYRFTPPTLKSFYHPDSTANVTLQDVENYLIPYFISYSFSPMSPDSILATLSYDHLPQEWYNKINPVIHPQITIPLLTPKAKKWRFGWFK